jgi:hypothetical protein
MVPSFVRPHSSRDEFRRPHFDVELEFIVELLFKPALVKGAK